MILNRRGFKRTATELAKELVYEYGASLTLCWQEKLPDTYIKYFTLRDETLVEGAIQKQLERSYKFFGYPDQAEDKE